MTTDAQLYVVRPGEQSFSNQTIGCISIRGIEFTGQTHEGQRCLDIGVESHPPAQPFTQAVGDKHTPVVFAWLQLNAEVWTRSNPRRQVGHVLIEQQGMLPIGTSRSGPTNWKWEVLPEDVEVVESARSNQGEAPLFFKVEITGIAKMIDTATGHILDVVPIRANHPQLTMEASHWERLMQYMEYNLPPSHAALAGLASIQHPSWTEATKRLEGSRSHLRAGEGYEALRAYLSVLESLVSPPYSADAWKKHLSALPEQKAVGIAELFSGMATFCNKVGHHRSRSDRDAAEDLPQMPLEHWETDLMVGAAQFVTAYALRLRSSGVLSTNPAKDA